MEFTNQLKSFKEGFRLEVGRRRQQKSRKKLIEAKGSEKINYDENTRKKKSRAKLIAEKGKEAMKKDQA